MIPTLEQLTDPAKLLELLRTSAIATIQETCSKIQADHVILFANDPEAALNEWIIGECLPTKQFDYFTHRDMPGLNFVYGLHRSGILINRSRSFIVRAEDFSAEQLVWLLERIKRYTTQTLLPVETTLKIFTT